MSQAKQQRVITFHYTLTDSEGQTLDSSRDAEPLSFMEGVGQIIPGLENLLATLQKGDKKVVTIASKEAYGERNEQLVVEVERAKLPKGDLQVGDQFQTQDPHSPPFTIVDVTETHAILDANHPLAGMDLTFDVEITEMRDATDEEKSHGHSHGPGGHHH
jgi:FKBP-type peptidyl-prolyl cis-trans isomerase SlyD